MVTLAAVIGGSHRKSRASHARRSLSPEAAWRDLVAGRLIVLRHEDEDGRRYLYVQPRSEPDGEVAELTEREKLVVSYRAGGQGLKRIAFELGVSVPTVARSLTSALAKLQLESDMDLPAVFGVGLRARG